VQSLLVTQKDCLHYARDNTSWEVSWGIQFVIIVCSVTFYKLILSSLLAYMYAAGSYWCTVNSLPSCTPTIFQTSPAKVVSFPSVELCDFTFDLSNYPNFQTDLRFSWMFDKIELTFKIIKQYGVSSQKAISCWSEASLILAKDFCYKFGGSKTSACVIVFELSSRTICSAYVLG